MRLNSTSTGFAASFGRLSIAGMLALLVVACSAIQLSYNNADRLLAFKLDSYLDLRPEQSKLIKERINGVMAWHRSTQLADYAQLLARAESTMQHHVTTEDILSFQHEINLRVSKIGERAAPDIATVALTFSAAQLERMERKLAEDNLKFRKENFGKSHNDVREGRGKRFIEHAEDWFGSLSREQKQLIRNTTQAEPAESREWADEREQRQRDILEVLHRIQREKPDAATATSWVRTFFSNFEEPPNLERRAALSALRQSNARLTAALANSSTPEQKVAIQKKLAGYRDDVMALAAKKSD